MCWLCKKQNINAIDISILPYFTLFLGKNKRLTREIFTQPSFKSPIYITSTCNRYLYKLRAFRQRCNFGNFQQFFHHNYRLKWKLLFQMVSSEKSSSHLSEYTLFQIFFSIFSFYKNLFLSEKYIS